MLIATWYDDWGKYWANFLLLAREGVIHLGTQKLHIALPIAATMTNGGTPVEGDPTIREIDVEDYLFLIEDSPVDFDKFEGLSPAPYGELLKYTPQPVIWKGFFVEARAAPIVLDKVDEYDEFTPVAWIGHSDWHAKMIKQAVQGFFTPTPTVIEDAKLNLGKKGETEWRIKARNLAAEIAGREKAQEHYEKRVRRGIEAIKRDEDELGLAERKLPRPSGKKMGLLILIALAMAFFALGYYLHWFTWFW